jgi:hypothetical protein
MTQENRPAERNVHAAVSPQACIDMGKNYGWKLRGWEVTTDKVLRVNCIFEGEQTSFEGDDRYEQQDLDRL